MAVTIQTIQSGPHNLILNLYIAGINSAATIYTGSATADNMSLVQAQWSLTGAPAQILWDATTDDVLVDLCAGNGFFLLEEAAVPNPRSSGVTGNINLTNAAGLTSGTVILKFKKS
jgi:hypothetical protein